jgi:hypothetical protein
MSFRYLILEKLGYAQKKLFVSHRLPSNHRTAHNICCQRQISKHYLCFFLNSLDSCGESAEDDSDSDSWEYCDEDEDNEDGEWEYYYEEIDTGHRKNTITKFNKKNELFHAEKCKIFAES